MKTSSKSSYSRCAQKICAHYKASGRHELPWRNGSPYQVLVSELMLQQTQVSRVTPKFHLWMERYPTLASLSNTTLEEVLTLWKGLGYQRRAKAIFMIAKNNTIIPNTVDSLLALPGVGRYTASAIMAFAYDTYTPLLETNVRTVLAVELGLDTNTSTEEEKHRAVTDLYKLTALSPKDFYYALMDYGSFLKQKGFSHTSTRRQRAYKGSFRQLRSRVLFALVEKKALPDDPRVGEALVVLEKEGFIKRRAKNESNNSYTYTLA